MTVQGFSDRLSQLQEDLFRLDDKITSVARLVKASKAQCEDEAKDTHRAISALEHRVNSSESLLEECTIELKNLHGRLNSTEDLVQARDGEQVSANLLTC